MGICTIRLDDITPDMNWVKFEIAKTLFDQYKIKPLLGVVPDNQDSTLQVGSYNPNFWEYINELCLEGWTIAQHGYRHIYGTKDSGILGINAFSEFAGLPYKEQYDKIKKGQEILQSKGIYATIFMAPGHTYDVQTIRALKANSFTYITDGYSNDLYEYKGIYFIPCTLSTPRIPKAYDTLCLHINTMEQQDFQELERFLKEQTGIIKNYAELLKPQLFKKKTITIALNEKKNLLLCKVKRFVATNPVMQDYFVRTDYKNHMKKIGKRIIGIPAVGIRLLFARKRK